MDYMYILVQYSKDYSTLTYTAIVNLKSLNIHPKSLRYTYNHYIYVYNPLEIAL